MRGPLGVRTACLGIQQGLSACPGPRAPQAWGQLRFQQLVILRLSLWNGPRAHQALCQSRTGRPLHSSPSCCPAQLSLLCHAAQSLRAPSPSSARMPCPSGPSWDRAAGQASPRAPSLCRPSLSPQPPGPRHLQTGVLCLLSSFLLVCSGWWVQAQQGWSCRLLSSTQQMTWGGLSAPR